MPVDVLGTRTQVAAFAEAFTVGIADALVPIAVQRGSAALVAAAAGALVVPTGKVFRLEGLYVGVVSTGAALVTSRIRVRWSPSGTALAATSPIIGPNVRVGFPAAPAAGSVAAPHVLIFPEALEFPAGATIGVTVIGSAAGHTLDLTLLGFDYTP